MIGKPYRLLVLFLLGFQLHGQTTDLSIAIETQDLSGTAISQVDIYEDFQYVITVLNSGNTVDNASISVNFDSDLTILSYNSQNSNAGASDFSNIDVTSNVLTASIATMPNNSSVELLVLVTAPTSLGGITANGTISPPTDTQDTNTSNNQAIISIDVLDVIIDFSVTQTQINPTEGTAINAWGDLVTYQFTITNNSAIAFPVSSIEGHLNLSSPNENGQPYAEFISLECLGATNGTLCPDLTTLNGNSDTVTSISSMFIFYDDHEMTSGGSITFQLVYRYTNFSCSTNPLPIDVNSVINIELNTATITSIDSNSVTTNLILAEACALTDLCIESVQTNPLPSVDLNYNQDITFETTVCNNGPLEAPMRFFFQNLSLSVGWEIVSVNCINTTGSVTCNDFNLSNNGQLWTSSDFLLQPNTTITLQTVVRFVEPCGDAPITVQIRSATNILDTQLLDSNTDNNYFSNYVTLPIPTVPCGGEESNDLIVTKTQIYPQLPIGSSDNNTASWGPITYEITVTNEGLEDSFIELQDYMPIRDLDDPEILATLTNIECVETTGTASCFTIVNANLGVGLDGITDDGNFDIFWEITPEENWELPANSSITFNVTIDWLPECSYDPMIATNVVSADYAGNLVDSNPNNNLASVNTYFAPCLDLIVQTYPEFTQVDINQTFNWIIDISNSTTSSNAIDVIFEDTLNSVFTIIGTPTCTVTSGNASCISSFNTTGNFITGIIPTMEAGSTVRISIPVSAPSFGGAFNNIAEAIPNASNNQELTPDSNISINSVQVIAPVLQKSFFPDSIIEGGQSELIFTVYNVASNPTQSNISFTDNLPTGITLSGIPNWVQDNGCTANFIGSIGDIFVGVEDLVFPDGIESCTFSVMVTSEIIGEHLNNFENFTNNYNINTSQTSATLHVIEDTSNIDIEIVKTAEPTEAFHGQNVDFTITATNLGTTTATLIEVMDALPIGFEFVSATPSFGTFDNTTLIWSIPNLNANTYETLLLTATVMSSNDLTNVALLNSTNEPDRNLTNNEDDATVEINNCLTIPEGISPNDDGSNDFLIIPCIEDYSNTLKIFNRYGTQIYEATNYANTWDGKANMGILKSSELLPVGTYFYILEINGLPNDIVGYVYLTY
ncbi:DUF7933 domain-containing protein [Winogradskyella endarachnes]|uniref:DUF11 domain-containing protein n=1 Tax=Winogradskyella endarachnes TaxID=2681965 RepID=A0A6L6UAG6_9FLAO|nr:gliding motility-associated C-terminal domain-containing protein [Winogradskyella endarachnes]MUU79188.1 DUF11 domain-containing protein [Winogradskyella endarachnes]